MFIVFIYADPCFDPLLIEVTFTPGTISAIHRGNWKTGRASLKTHPLRYRKRTHQEVGAKHPKVPFRDTVGRDNSAECHSRNELWPRQRNVRGPHHP
jgi:hypothetical protein